MRRHPSRLIDAGITPERYWELQAVCRQYPGYVQKVRRARAGIVDRPRRRSGKWRRPDPTGNEAAWVADLCAWADRRIRLIEACAEGVGPAPVARAILKSVTEGRTYEQLQPPCGRNQFFDARLAFYVRLNEALMNET